MTAFAQDAVFFEGEYKELPFGPVTDRDGATVDLTGASATWIMYRKNEDGTNTILLTKTKTGGTITFDSPNTLGTGKVIIATGDTTDMGGANYDHEMVITKSSKPEVSLTGTIELLKSAIL